MDVLQADGTFKRLLRWEPLGLVDQQSERAAWKQFQPFLDAGNRAAMQAPKTGITLAEFVEEWRESVAVNLKSSTVRAAESHCRAHIVPKLGSLPLTEVWRAEGGRGEEPNWERIVSDKKSNVRDCLQYVEAELLARGKNGSYAEPVVVRSEENCKKIEGKSGGNSLWPCGPRSGTAGPNVVTRQEVY